MTEMIHGSNKNLGFLLTRSANLWNEMLMEELKKLDHQKMKPSHGAVLIPLFDRGKISISEIMSFSQLKKQTVTTYIRELLDLKLISRKADVNDKRKFSIELTAKGIKLKSSSNLAVEIVNERFSEVISKVELENLQTGLSKILESPKLDIIEKDE